MQLQSWKVKAACALPPGAFWETRRIAGKGDSVWPLLGEVLDIYSASGVLKFRVGRNDALSPGRGELTIARATLAYIKPAQMLQDITEEEAELELVKTFQLTLPIHAAERQWTARQTFALLWDTIYARQPRKRWASNPLVWPLGFTNGRKEKPR